MSRTAGCLDCRIGAGSPTRVPFLELAPAYLELRDELDAAWQRVMERGWYVLGPEVEAFEREFADHCGTRHCVGVGNGLDALILMLRALDIGPGDEVIVPGNTYIATWLAVSHVGAVPVPVDPIARTHQIDPDLVEQRITSRTRAILAVHLYGIPADMDRLRAIADAHGIDLLEDAAQAHGAELAGRRCGSLSRAAGFSFYPTKNLGCFGDGGAVTTDDPEVADRVRILRNYGSRKKNENEMRGWNSRLDELQAALLRVRLGALDEWNGRRASLATRYREELPRVLPEAQLPEPTAGSIPAWHLFVIRYPERERLAEQLATSGIGTMVHYPIPPHHSEAYSHEWFPPLPVSERLAAEVLSLPLGPHLDEELQAEVLRVLADAG